MKPFLSLLTLFFLCNTSFAQDTLNRQSSFPGGEDELIKFVYCNLDLKGAKYSPDNKGQVYMKFTVDTTGKVTDIGILKTPSEDYSKEAIRIAKLMPKWITATQNGKAIPQDWTLPIVFDYDWRKEHCK